MALNFSLIETFITDRRERMGDKTLMRHERYRMLSELARKLQSTLRNFEIFDSEFASIVVDAIERATDTSELNTCHKLALAKIKAFFNEEETIIDVHDLLRIVRDRLTIKVLELAENEMVREGYGTAPARYLWAGLGSEGRDEQTIVTDQDNLIIYSDKDGEFAKKELRDACYEYLKNKNSKVSRNKLTFRECLACWFEVFSVKASDMLHAVGFERCKGGVMAANDKWRGSLADWKERVEARMTYEQGVLDPLDLIILTDARAIHGDAALLDEFLQHFFAMLSENKRVMKEFIQSAVVMPSALSFFGNFKVEKEGEHKGKFNMKLFGWAPLILSVRMTSLANGIYEKNTIKRIKLLRRQRVIKKDMEKDLIDAYCIFVRFRLMNQIGAGDANVQDAHYLRPDMLGQGEQEKLRKAMKTVESFQKYMQETLLFGQAF
ncbi:MAG TPA: putative nucleotidyltransferase substrate binding domain-containing protein [Syntrophorhabdaceae bacterium]|nr:putative nucleotidyltransferase substrate binding domain-containing protein [Syntrophorhabdaceae bacterium]